MIFKNKNFHCLALSGQNASREKISIYFLFLPVPARETLPLGPHSGLKYVKQCI